MEKLKEYDVDDLIDMLKLDSEMLVEYLECHIEENYEELMKEIEGVQTPWDDYYD